MASVLPEWKQHILKQRLAKEEGTKESSTDDARFVGLPTWKRDLLLKKEEEQRKQLEADKPRLVFGTPRGGGQSSTDSKSPASTTTSTSTAKPFTTASSPSITIATNANTSSSDALTERRMSFQRNGSGSGSVGAGVGGGVGGGVNTASTSSPLTAKQNASIVSATAPGAARQEFPGVQQSVRDRVAAMSTKSESPVPARASFSRGKSGETAATTGVSIKSIVQNMTAENKQEIQLREKQLRRRSDPALSAIGPGGTPVPRSQSHVLGLPRTPVSGILASPDRPKLSRKLSWSDMGASQPLAVVGPTTYYSDSESEDAPTQSSANSANNEDDEEATGLALRVHLSLAERISKSKSQSPNSQSGAGGHSSSSSTTSTTTASSSYHSSSSSALRGLDDDAEALILNEDDAAMIM